MNKTCKYCKTDQDIDQFYKSKRHTSGYGHKCKTCYSNYSKKRYKENPERQREISIRYFQKNPSAKRRTAIKHLYGISLEEYSELLKCQNNKCAICDRSRSEFKREFDLDHCHATGRVRGLLCPKCNKGIGLFEDDPTLLTKASNYLKTNEL